MTTSRLKMEPRKKDSLPLRKGFTTGACAAAAAKAAAYALITEQPVEQVEITLPTGRKVAFFPHSVSILDDLARATVIKDAGDDPDVTNGAEIGAVVGFYSKGYGVVVKGGLGVGKVTKPGLAVAVGQPAINPVPMKMIKDELTKVLKETGCPLGLEAAIFVTGGEELAKRTMNARLGIVGGISILGTTGIVEPISTRAWTDTILAAMDVAQACGVPGIVLTPGRTSEAAAMRTFPGLPEEAFIQMGDHVGFSLMEARKKGFTGITIVGQFGKLVKMAMGNVNTNVKDSSLEVGFLAELAQDLGFSAGQVRAVNDANTAREVFLYVRDTGRVEFFRTVCEMVESTARGILGGKTSFNCIMVDYEGEPV